MHLNAFLFSRLTLWCLNWSGLQHPILAGGFHNAQATKQHVRQGQLLHTFEQKPAAAAAAVLCMLQVQH